MAKTTFESLLSGIIGTLEEARRRAARSVNAILTAAYWDIGRRIVEHEQKGSGRAVYGSNLLERLSHGLLRKYGRGFNVDNLQRMRQFYLLYSSQKIYAMLSRKSGRSGSSNKNYATASRNLTFQDISNAFPLSWSHYVLLLPVKSEYARKFYQTESLRGGWSVRQLERQINSQFYERTALSKNKAAMLIRGGKAKPQDKLSWANLPTRMRAKCICISTMQKNIGQIRTKIPLWE